VELVASLPPDIVAAADPTARPAASAQRSSRPDDAAASATAPFDLLLALLTAPLPGGQSLPAAGNALPAAGATDVVPTSGSAKPVTTQPGLSAGADLLARLKLSLAPAAPPTDPNAAQTESPAAGAAPPTPFVELDLPAPPQQPADKTLPVSALQAPPVPAAPAAAPVPASPDASAAVEAAVPQTAAADQLAKLVRVDTSRNADRREASSAPAAGVAELRAAAANPIVAPAPVAATADGLARPSQHEWTPDALPLVDNVAAVDSTPAAAAPAHAPTAAHATQSSPQAPDAAAASGAPIDTHADHWHEALASRVQVLVDQHVGEARIRLSPPELGSLDVKISLVEDKTFVQLTAATSAARDELAQSLPRLRELFAASGLSLGGATVQSGSGGQAGHESAPRTSTPGYSPFGGPPGDDFEPIRAVARPTSRIDLFA
jgi:flagellar hook-length control protein FliK